MMETEKRILFFSKYSEDITVNFISDESSSQGLSDGILFFSFYRVVEELLKKEF